MKEVDVYVLFKGDSNFHSAELLKYKKLPNGADIELYYPHPMEGIEEKEISHILVNASELERVRKNEGN